MAHRGDSHSKDQNTRSENLAPPRHSAPDSRCFEVLRRLLKEEISLAPDHREDLRKSGLTDDTILQQHFCSIWPQTLHRLLGFSVQGADSAMLIPFPNPAGGLMDHIRVKVFPATLWDREGHSIKYLQPKGSPVRLFLPVATMAEALNGEVPLWLVEGEKKSLAVAQLGLPAIGFCGIHAWHTAGSRELLSDFDLVALANRIVELVPDGDVQTNQHVRRGAEGFALALARRGAKPRLVVLPDRLP